MKYLTLISSLLLSFVSLAQENLNLKKPLYENHDSLTVQGYKIETSYYVFEEPPTKKKFDLNLERSINRVRPFTKFRHISKVNNEVAFDVFYETTELGLRKIPTQFLPKNPTEHLIVAGDSNTFGDGVATQHTLPVLLSTKMPSMHPYN